MSIMCLDFVVDASAVLSARSTVGTQTRQDQACTSQSQHGAIDSSNERAGFGAFRSRVLLASLKELDAGCCLDDI